MCPRSKGTEMRRTIWLGARQHRWKRTFEVLSQMSVVSYWLISILFLTRLWPGDAILLRPTVYKGFATFPGS